jgi:hypothetical protein
VVRRDRQARVRARSGLELVPARPETSTGFGSGRQASMLFSFERPGAAFGCSTAASDAFSPDLENCTVGQNTEWFRSDTACRFRAIDHRQDIKGMWWMPWHQEPKKDVDGCDKPR